MVVWSGVVRSGVVESYGPVKRTSPQPGILIRVENNTQYRLVFKVKKENRLKRLSTTKRQPFVKHQLSASSTTTDNQQP